MLQQQQIQQFNWFSYQMALYYSNMLYITQSMNRSFIQSADSAATSTNNAPVAHSSPPNSNIQLQFINRIPEMRGVTFTICPPWKRCFAEIIDFFFLFIMKITFALFIFDLFDLADNENPIMSILYSNTIKDFDDLIDAFFNKNVNIRIPFELIYLEMVNKMFIILFEALCLRKGVGMMVGGQTPGKRIMGIKVISCLRVSQLQGNQILVYPATDLGFMRSFVRSTLKNLILFFPPLGLSALLFSHYRAFYDRVAQSIVVEAGGEAQGNGN